MKKLILVITSIFLLVVQIQAQVTFSETPSTPPIPKLPKVKHPPRLASTTPNKLDFSTHKSYATNTVVATTDMQDQGDDPMRSKAFSKSFSVDRNDKINLSNQYGSLTIKTWDKKEVKIDADIKAYANTDSEAQSLLDDVDVSASKSEDGIVFKSSLSNPKGSWGRGSKNGKRWRREVKIYVTVYMPATLALTASQSFGNITMDDYVGPTSIKVQYGNFNVGKLSNVNNYISVQFGKTTIEDINQATVKHEYGSGLNIGSINTLKLNAQFVGTTIGTIKNNANIKQEYGSGLTIGKTGNLTLDANFVKVKIGAVTGNANISTEYGGGLNIDKVEPSCKNLDIKAQFSKTNIDFGTNYNADFNVSTAFGGFNAGQNVSSKRTDDEKDYSQKKQYVGTVGKGGSANVKIKSEYGSVTIN